MTQTFTMAWSHAVFVSLLACGLYYYFTDRSEFGNNLTTHLSESYDYIVVGAGSAGCAVASRLSEDPKVTVLLLEAGGDDRGDRTIMTPGDSHHLMHSKYDWEFYTEPQKHGLNGFDGKRAYWPRGKVLGGTSNLYSMVYVRGHRLDFDKWAERGAHGWAYKDVLPFFLKSEDMTDSNLAKSKYHSQGGPMKVSVPHNIPLTDHLIKGGLELGLKERDPNGDVMEGVSQVQSNSYRGVRWSSSRGYLHPVMHRPNLHVKVNAHVTKILTENKKVVGVQMITGNKKVKVKVNKEVVISSGAIGSPHLLMLSGIGPRRQLEHFGIPVVADLPVGENLHDHLFFEYSIGINSTLSATAEIQGSLWTRLQHRLFGKGVLSSSHYVETQVFDYTDDKSRRAGWPDLQIMFHQTPWTLDNLAGFGYSRGTLQESEHRNTHQDMFACEASLLRPESRGTVRLQSNDPFDYPLLDPNYLQRQEDVDFLVRGIRYCQRYMRTPSLQKFGAVPADSPNRFCRQHKYDSDSYWACMVRQRIHTIYHPVGTCKMGARSDPTAVVDHTLRVQGVSGLRVADGSIMPAIISGNTNTPIIMIGEKAAHMIKTGA